MGQDTDKPTGTGTTVEGLRERIQTALCDRLEEEWDEVLGQWSDAAPSERKAMRSDVAELRDRVLDPLLSIDTLEELRRCLAIGYIEVKCRWTMLNIRIQHRTTQAGRPEESLIYRATCVSHIVQALEPLLTREHVENLAAVLAEPIAEPRQ